MAPHSKPLRAAAFGSIYMVALLNAPLPSSPFQTPLFPNVKRKSSPKTFVSRNAINPKQQQTASVAMPRPPDNPPTNEQYNKQMNTVFQYRRTTPAAAQQQQQPSTTTTTTTMNSVFQYRTVISSPQSSSSSSSRRRNVEISETSSASNGDITINNSETIDMLDSTDTERNEEISPMDADVPMDDGKDSASPVSQKVLDIVTETAKPLLSPPIQHNVNGTLIQGAAIAGASLALLATKTLVTVPVASLASAYVSIHPGRAGDAARAVGRLAHAAGVLALNSTKSMGRLWSVREAVEVEEEDEEIRNVLREVKEAEMMVDELKKVKERQGQREQQVVVDGEEDGELEEVALVIDDEMVEYGVEAADMDSMTLDWATLTVKELKVELKERGLKVSGRKAELIQRLEEYAP